jgi:predicted TIM-barrel fold metal-dependent hydrolase
MPPTSICKYCRLLPPAQSSSNLLKWRRFARETNDYLADAVRSHPTRFSAFATLPTANPNAAAAELERTIHDYGFKGALINGHIQGRYLDDKVFWPIFERAEALNVPIYLHPTQPPKPVIEASYGGFAPIVTDMLAGAGWGWHIETAVHVIRIILGGTFDRYPRIAARGRPHGRDTSVHVTTT